MQIFKKWLHRAGLDSGLGDRPSSVQTTDQLLDGQVLSLRGGGAEASRADNPQTPPRAKRTHSSPPTPPVSQKKRKTAVVSQGALEVLETPPQISADALPTPGSEKTSIHSPSVASNGDTDHDGHSDTLELRESSPSDIELVQDTSHGAATPVSLNAVAAPESQEAGVKEVVDHNNFDETESDSRGREDDLSQWREEQVFLNAILKSRNEYHIMPTSWKFHVRSVPLPDNLFYKESQREKIFRPKIFSHDDRYDFLGAKALGKLFDLPRDLRGFRDQQWGIRHRKTLSEVEKDIQRNAVSNEIVKGTRKAIENAIQWSMLDANLARFGKNLPPTTLTIHMREGEDNENLVQNEMGSLCAVWRALVDETAREGEPKPRVPVIYGFCMINHILMIITMDADNPKALCHVAMELNLTEPHQSQWNALAIMLTICWARDNMRQVVDCLELPVETKVFETDPDI